MTVVTTCSIIVFTFLLTAVGLGGRVQLTERQDLDARELAHAILEYLIGLGERDVLEAHVVDGQDLITGVDGAASVRNACRLHALD